MSYVKDNPFEQPGHVKFVDKHDRPWIKKPIEKMHLIPIRDVEESERLQLLYDLLSEREKDESISHERMPAPQEHRDFVLKNKGKYRVWYFIKDHEQIVGSTYMTHKGEIGVSVFKEFRGCGYGKFAVKDQMRRWRCQGKKYYANINPANEKSIALFESLGFKLIQVTYSIDPPPL